MLLAGKASAEAIAACAPAVDEEQKRTCRKGDAKHGREAFQQKQRDVFHEKRHRHLTTITSPSGRTRTASDSSEATRPRPVRRSMFQPLL